jgi:hypothetical protein
MSEAFWKEKRLDEMTEGEWESLCDRCGQCCLIRLKDEDTGKLYLTDVACRLLDVKACRCSNYSDRLTEVPTCIKMTPVRAAETGWLPTTCAYRILAEGEDLPSWHPLITGTYESVVKAGVSVSGWAVSESQVSEDELIERIQNPVNTLLEGTESGD